jgi:hypothetical protein
MGILPISASKVAGLADRNHHARPHTDTLCCYSVCAFQRRKNFLLLSLHISKKKLEQNFHKPKLKGHNFNFIEESVSEYFTILEYEGIS